MNRCSFSRVSCEKGDPGEVAYGKLCADKLTPKVLLDGVEQKCAVTADEIEGFVKRHILSDGGNPAINLSTDEFLYETIRGKVEIWVK